MKNYFKLMSLLLGMVLCSAAFVACGDDDDDGQYAGNRLIGEWVAGNAPPSTRLYFQRRRNLFCLYASNNGGR